MMNTQIVQSLGLPLFQKYRVKRVALFGSVIRDEVEEESDVDLLVEMPKEGRPYDFFNLQADLADLFKCKVDLVEYDALHPRLKDRVLNDAVMLYQA